MVLTIIEVSQKQAYIFAENKLKSNVARSEEIAYVTGVINLKEKLGGEGLFDEKENLVYAGGGHTILQYETPEAAKMAMQKYTRSILAEYPQMDFFVHTIKYSEKESPAQNINNLIKGLEKKKSVRQASFHQEYFGVEQHDIENQSRTNSPKGDIAVPDGFRPAIAFEDLGNSKGKSGFIAVVHIDGNAMGKRVAALQESEENKSGNWNGYRELLRRFSESVGGDFRSALEDTKRVIAETVHEGGLDVLDLKEDAEHRRFFPFRRIISEGDDICFVTEGRIGIETAVIFLKALSTKINAADHQGYAACAGVAIVHAKYPFYRAYELAETLCSNAKKKAAALSPDHTGATISAIDWHIEMGEIADSLEEIRAVYRDYDNGEMIKRPYVVGGEDTIDRGTTFAQYEDYRRMCRVLKDRDRSVARSVLKELRGVLKQGRTQTEYYLKYHKLDGAIKPEDIPYLFDVIESMDLWLPLKEANR